MLHAGEWLAHNTPVVWDGRGAIGCGYSPLCRRSDASHNSMQSIAEIITTATLMTTSVLKWCKLTPMMRQGSLHDKTVFIMVKQANEQVLANSGLKLIPSLTNISAASNYRVRQVLHLPTIQLFRNWDLMFKFLIYSFLHYYYHLMYLVLRQPSGGTCMQLRKRGRMSFGPCIL